MPASIFNGSAVKILKNILRFKDGSELASADAANLSGTSSNVQSQIDAVVADVAALPDPIVYKGTWDASTNTPTLSNSDTGKTGFLYQVQVAGSVNFGAGSISFDVGDKVVNDGTLWSKWDLTDAVTSVNSATGAVTVNAINQLSGDGTTSVASGSQSKALTLATVNSNVGTFGSASSVASVTVNAKGLTTAASNVAIQVAQSQVTNLSTDLTGKANADLSNLTATAINQNLIFSKTAPILKSADSGTTGEPLIVQSGASTGANASASATLTLKSGDKSAGSGASGTASLKSGDVLSGTSGAVSVESGTANTTIGASGTAGLKSGNVTSASGASGAVTVTSGDSSGGNSGDVTVTTGTAAGTRGKVIINNAVDPTNLQDAATKSYVDSRALNYVTNFGATVDTTGWAMYADAASAQPVDGTGGSPTTTWTRSTSSPLRGVASFLLTKDAANRQGEGASYAFSIDAADQGRVMSINFDYKIASGTFASGDVTVWVYDVTNSVLLSQPSGNSIISTSIVSQQGQCTFQTAINSTSYRLILHVSTTSASAYSLNFDNVSVGPQVNASGGVDTDWTSFTPTGSWSTNTTYSGKWRRVGGDAEIQYFLTVSNAPTSASLSLNMPTGMVIDTTRFADPSPANNATLIQYLGGTIQDANGNYYSVAQAAYASSTSLFNVFYSNTSTNSASVTQAAPMTWATGDKLWLYVKIPIQGWGSNTVLSTSANTRLVDFVGQNTGGTQALTSDVTLINYVAQKDTVAGWTGNSYVVQVPGDYQVALSFSDTVAQTWSVIVYVNSVSTAKRLSTTGGNFANGSALLQNLKVGDAISLRSSGQNGIINSSSFLYISMLQGPQQIAASESINARYFASATSISGSLATVVWTTKDYDTHNSMASGLYTVPAPGKYRVAAQVTLSGTFVLNSSTTIQIQKNSVAVSDSSEFIAAAVTNYITDIDDLINCAAGDVLRIQVSSSGTGPAIVSSNTKNFISISREGA